jgi:2-keto-4-pentenoate hydratase
MTSLLTQLLLDHRAAGTTINTLSDDLVPSDMGAAYRVQSETILALGPLGAWKVSPYPDSGEPVCSPLPLSYVKASGAPLPRAALHDPHIEVEIAFTLDRDLGAGATADDARAAIGSVHVALEIIASRYTDRHAVPRTAALADLQSGAGIVLGAPIGFDPTFEFGAETLALRFDNAEVAGTANGPTTDNAIRALAWLASHAHSRSTPLLAGTVIITGARLGPKPLTGKAIVATSVHLGQVTTTFE